MLGDGAGSAYCRPHVWKPENDLRMSFALVAAVHDQGYDRLQSAQSTVSWRVRQLKLLYRRRPLLRRANPAREGSLSVSSCATFHLHALSSVASLCAWLKLDSHGHGSNKTPCGMILLSVPYHQVLQADGLKQQTGTLNKTPPG